MKIKISIVLALLLAGVMARADAPQSALSVAVYDFEATGETARALGSKPAGWNASMWNAWRETVHDFGPKVTALVTANLAAETNLVMVERAELTKALNEQAFGLSGMVSSDAAAKIGQITGAKVLVAGQVFLTDDGHLTIVASIIGTETGRLFADKVEGTTDNVSEMTSDLSRKIVQTITAQTTNLVAVAQESNAEHLERIIKSINGTNRPSVSVQIQHAKSGRDIPAETELETILLKAGFNVVDENSEGKPDVEITGHGVFGGETRRSGLVSCSYDVEVKIQERKTGRIITFEHQEGGAIESGANSARTKAEINAVDELSERIMPLLAK
jgi:TolB-like protein